MQKAYSKIKKSIKCNCNLFSARIKIFQENFLDVNLEDERFKHIKVVLVSADCSRSGVANPVDFIVSEAEGTVHICDIVVHYMYAALIHSAVR